MSIAMPDWTPDPMPDRTPGPMPEPLQGATPGDQPRPFPDDDAQHRRILRHILDVGDDLLHLLHQKARAEHHAATGVAPAPTPAPAGAPATTSAPAPTATPPNTNPDQGADTQAAPQAPHQTTQTTHQTPNETTIQAYDRLTRALRRTIHLARTLDHPPTQTQTPANTQPRLDHPARTAARKQILRTVEDAIHQHAAGPGAEALHAELRDRLDAPDLDDDIAAKPINLVISHIIRDLGLETLFASGYKRRAPAEAAILAARAAAPPGQASNPALAIAWPKPKPTPNTNTNNAEHIALMLASTRTRGK